MKEIYATDIHNKDNNLFELYLYNVGQGDHMLFKFPSLEYGIIDFYYNLVEDLPEPPALTYFKELEKVLPKEDFQKITISFICISHTDKDHIKGAVETVEWFYSKGIFIKDFWFGASRDEKQLGYFLKDKISSIVNQFDFADKINNIDTINFYNSKIDKLFEYFEKWKSNLFNSERYQTESKGSGEHLVDIRMLRRPTVDNNIDMLNIGPLQSHIEEYINNLNFDIVKKILGIKDSKTKLDNNMLSHILRVRYGDLNMIFTGDSKKEVIESCIERYHDQNYPFYDTHGPIGANFIKVGHHGARSSSSVNIWSGLIADEGEVFLGISAGRHKGYSHPHSETIEDIKKINPEAHILSTNLCSNCLFSSGFNLEHHKWYDDRNKVRNQTLPKSEEDQIIKVVLDSTFGLNTKSQNPIKNLGLFAYVFEMPKNKKESIKIKVALVEKKREHACFFDNNTHKEFLKCKDCILFS